MSLFGNGRKLEEALEENRRLKKQAEQLLREKKELKEQIGRLEQNADDSYHSYPKIEFLTKTYFSLLADIKNQLDAVILSVKFASEKIVRGDIEMLDTDAILARALSKVMKMPREEIEARLQDSLLEDVNTGTLQFTDAEEFNSSREYGFRNNQLIRNIVLPEGIGVIKRGFFYGCANLRQLRIPDSVERIEEYAFFGCASLAAVKFGPDSRLKRIGAYAFSSCISLSRISLPQGVEIIDTAAFRECSVLESVDCTGEKIAKIGNHAFQNCTKLKSFRIPEGISILQTSLFGGCGALEALEVPGSVELVMDNVFKGCMGLKELSFQSGETRIGRYTLDGLSPDTRIVVAGYALSERPVPEQVMRLEELMAGPEER